MVLIFLILTLVVPYTQSYFTFNFSDITLKLTFKCTNNNTYRHKLNSNVHCFKCIYLFYIYLLNNHFSFPKKLLFIVSHKN